MNPLVLRVITLVWLPAKILEEAIHALAAWPWADRIVVWIDPEGGDAGCDVVVSPDAPDWGLLVAAYAPMVAGLVSGATLITVAIVYQVQPASLTDWGLVTCMALWWGHLTLPSADDREVLDDA